MDGGTVKIAMLALGTAAAFGLDRVAKDRVAKDKVAKDKAAD